MLWQGGVIFGVVKHTDIGTGLRVYRKEVTKGNTINNRAIKCNTKQDAAIRGARYVLTRYYVIPAKGGNIRESIPGISRFRIDEPEGKSCVFDRLGGCGGRTGCVSEFVSSF